MKIRDARFIRTCFSLIGLLIVFMIVGSAIAVSVSLFQHLTVTGWAQFKTTGDYVLKGLFIFTLVSIISYFFKQRLHGWFLTNALVVGATALFVSAVSNTLVMGHYHKIDKVTTAMTNHAISMTYVGLSITAVALTIAWTLTVYKNAKTITGRDAKFWLNGAVTVAYAGLFSRLYSAYVDVHDLTHISKFSTATLNNALRVYTANADIRLINSTTTWLWTFAFSVIILSVLIGAMRTYWVRTRLYREKGKTRADVQQEKKQANQSV